MRLALSFLLWVTVAAAPEAMVAKPGDLTAGGGTARSARAVDESSATRDPVQRFVENNVAETLYHELGHALIDVLDLPVYGSEEFAADRFSVVLMNRLNHGRHLIDMARDVAAAYDGEAVKERTAKAQALWDVHGPDRQRYYTFACLIFGADPDARAGFADDFGLPDDRAKSCEREYAKAARSWGEVLDTIAAGAPGKSLRMDWMLDASSPITRFVSAEVDRLNRRMVLPDEVTVSVISCGEPNAFYDTGTREITICTELAEELTKLAP